MGKEEDILNECGHRNSERVEAFKKFPSAICPACLFERIKELERVRAGVRVSLIAMRTVVKKGGSVSEEQLKDLIDELTFKP